jgi:signal transduction histidine kinase
MGSGWRLSLQGKLVAMMFGMLLLVLATLFALYWRAESQLIAQVERHTSDLSTAIQISVEQITSKGRSSEARLQDYVQRLQQRGVREISIVSNEEEVIASSNPRRVGARVDPKRKDILITARLGEESEGGRAQKTYNLFVPVVVGNQRTGYVLISMILDDFAALARASFLKRLVATILVFTVGIGGIALLAWTYVKPISRVVEAARRVAQGSLEERLPTGRRDEIGELNQSFNEMVERLREKEALEKRLHQAERLSAIAHLASGIAHEVRNPLNSISLIIDHLAAQFSPRAGAEREEIGRLTGLIKQEIHRLNAMIEAFLKFGRPLELKRQPTDVRRVLDEVLEVASQKVQEEHIQVTREYGEDLPPVWIDVPHMKTCFLNLVLNAVQAMSPKGGNLSVAVGVAADGAPRGSGFGDLSNGESGVDVPQARIHQSTDAPAHRPAAGDWVEVSIRDTGVGVAPENLDKVFEPYFTTKDVGIGLGLALTKQILEQHGGGIALSSELGKGTVVRLRLPAGAPTA